MNIYETKLKIRLNEDIHYLDSYIKISDFINYLMLYDEDLQHKHTENTFKYYCFNSLYPFSKDKVYKQGDYYDFTIRTVEQAFIAKIMMCITKKSQFRQFKVIRFNYNERTMKKIKELVCITPAIITTDTGYWTQEDGIDIAKKKIVDNLYKKYKAYSGQDILEDSNIIESIEVMNKIPIKIPYKNIHMLGSKFKLTVANTEIAQLLGNMALGAGILEKNSLGMGFCFANY